MATLYGNGPRDGTHSWRSRGLVRREFRQDHGSGPEEPRHFKKNRGKDKPKRKPGSPCPETGASHVYVWGREDNWPSGRWHDHVYYRKVCAGCGKRYNGRGRRSYKSETICKHPGPCRDYPYWRKDPARVPAPPTRSNNGLKHGRSKQTRGLWWYGQ